VRDYTVYKAQPSTYCLLSNLVSMLLVTLVQFLWQTITICGLLCVILFHYCSAFEASFSQSTYYGKVFTLEDTVGKVLVKTEVLYNESIITSFVTKHYNLYRSDSTYFTIDNNGTVTLTKNLPSRRQYSFQISFLYTVALKSGGTRSGFLTADCRVQGIGTNCCYTCVMLLFYPTQVLCILTILHTELK